MISQQEALEIILSSVRPVANEVIDLYQAHGRVLAENIKAAENIPPFDNSTFRMIRGETHGEF